MSTGTSRKERSKKAKHCLEKSIVKEDDTYLRHGGSCTVGTLPEKNDDSIELKNSSREGLLFCASILVHFIHLPDTERLTQPATTQIPNFQLSYKVLRGSESAR